MRVPYNDLRLQYLDNGSEIRDAIDMLMRTGKYCAAPLEFERNFAASLQSKYAIGTISTISAFQAALAACDLRPYDEVIIAANVHPSVISAIKSIRAIPVLVDIDPVTFNIDQGIIEKSITTKTKIIVATHKYGLPCSMSQIMRIAKKHNLRVVEDVCQAIGSTFNAKITGSIGDIGVFSFNPNGNLGSFSDGGMLTTNDQSLYERFYTLIDCDAFNNPCDSLNCRMSALTATVLAIKLNKLATNNTNRVKIASEYISQLRSISELSVPHTPPNRVHVYNVFLIKCQSSASLAGHLTSEGIDIHNDFSLPHQTDKSLFHYQGRLPNAEKITGMNLMLPIYPEMKTEEISHVCEAIRSFYKKA